ncbi:MAG: D-alanyl-D-alanine carboxypeptidase, partial [Mycobacterium sp.]|nr:D-alanyl-D-alanine carboxypeptidase [Mycobacterium sp.]
GVAKPDPSPAGTPNNANAGRPDVHAMPVRVGVAVIGSVIVFSLIMCARALNRRPV